ncbi:phosphoenolpyruvate--protein phosphotransferase [[Clostridium] polysaccharolyticum]|uniref:Phosphoenolpyruvate-protein phosphotransferase n=1 Tax=[Clostridium] polysaccharolyticum TaxID=29364 RepID=A0A1I0E797_9FIRM|nr:phosphoenolpyruvate--protein phosphotransferase [[Clostridium] polysaccharolyticum]SET40864.1 phosphoenolpyruvate--protein phosphotransferase [[Clostridium] polysaccharolyticum]
MKVYNGKSVFGGIAIGKISVYNKEQQQIERYHVEDAAAEVERFMRAKETAVNQLKALYDKALAEVGEANAMIFEVHQMMLDDLDYNDSITNMIETQKVNSEYAVGVTADNFAQMFSSMDDDYMKERAADVKDISERLVTVLSGGNGEGNKFSEPVIILADDLAPSETVQLDKDKVLAFVTRQGSSNSHTAILARTMSIPALIGVDVETDGAYNGVKAVVNGFTGEFIIEPDQETEQKMEEKRQEELEKKVLLQQMKGQGNVTLDGQTINLYANIGNVEDVASVLQNDAGGIGLFRSEFLYLESNDYPTEEEQFAKYRQVVETMHGKKVIIRTLDIGADKQVDYFNMDKEENPALGYRAIRICLDRKEIFRTQLRALFRASAFGKLSIMFPMIISVNEVREIKKMVEEVKAELKEQGIAYSDDVELGIMIETPASVMISDMLAKEVDFFSIGTNDLTQYTLAIDRQNPKLDPIYDPHHLAVLRMIKTVVDNAHANGIWAGICGELGADPELTETFLAMGLDELSVSPSLILGLRKAIRSTDVSKVKEEVLAKF